MDSDAQANLVDEINMTRSLLDSTERQISTVDKAYQDLAVTLAVVNEKAELADKAVRISIGSGMYVEGKISDSDKIIVPVGSDVFVESTTGEAKKKIEESMESLRKTLDELLQRQSELRIRYDSLMAIAQRATS
ncbi:MAG: prefoldin subunit alpha [Candidatus Thermoplasmatota archaeon]|nr:prefoldin subunit alpha [Candidatus Thermoplasmatota archaeon]